MNSTMNVPVIQAGNAVAQQNMMANGISLAGATNNGSNLALASASAAEVLGQMQIAKAFPRNEIAAIKRIEKACSRPELANISSYTYSKGGTEVTGASIHLLKAIAALWGNIKSGYTIVESTALFTKCAAFASDLETNWSESVPFFVRHIRHTRKGDYPLTDDREIYEAVANQASRRERKCLEAVIPADVVQMALAICQKTMIAKCGEITEERIKDMVESYGKFNVSREELEAFIKRPLTAVAPAQWVRLMNVYKSLRDGIAVKDDIFKGGPESSNDSKKDMAKDDKPSDKKDKKHGKTVEDFLAEHHSKVEDPNPEPEKVPVAVGASPLKAQEEDLGDVS